MTYDEYKERYNPDYKCYAVYKHLERGTIERGLILDPGLQYSLSGKPYLHLDSYYTKIPLVDVIDIIVTPQRS